MIQLPVAARYGITILVMALLLLVSIVPGHAKPGDSAFVFIVAKTPTTVQKLLHFSLYGLLTFLWMWTLVSVQSRFARMALAATITILFGAAMEVLQTRIPGRFGTIVDVGLNAAGALRGLAAATLLL